MLYFSVPTTDFLKLLSSPHSSQDLCSIYIMVSSFFNLHVASIFAYHLVQMRAPFQRSRIVIRRLLFQSLAGNLTSGSLAIAAAVLWVSRTDMVFYLPMELLGRIYPLVLLLALLAREDARTEMNDLRGCVVRTEMELDFLQVGHPSARRHSTGSTQGNSSEGYLNKQLWYRSGSRRKR